MEQQSAWIERIFDKLTSIYGDAFTRNWIDADFEGVKKTWAEILGGFAAEDIGAAIKACYSQPKPPNAPEFASLCRQHMNTRIKSDDAPLTPEERNAARKVADTVAKAMKEKEDNDKGYMFNGVLITKYKQWAVNLMKREADGESLPQISKESWREVLGFDKTVSAGVVADKLRSAVA